jgi:signal transduction histidine kinase
MHPRLYDRAMRTDSGWAKYLTTGWLVSAAIGAVATVQWYGRLREVERRAEEAERTRDEMARRRAVEERLRIARELHDSLTHSISVIKVQAGVAAHLARKNGDEPSAALLAIQEASSDAVRELRSTLDVLRREEDMNGSGLQLLPALVERARSSGLPTTYTIRGEERPLPPEVDQTAYRVVQEALTNVTRHAGEATATVQIIYGTGTLTIRVDDDGTGSKQPPVPGYGLVGMRERITALGGSLHAEPGSSRGFTVLAELPANGAS